MYISYLISDIKKTQSSTLGASLAAMELSATIYIAYALG